MLGNSLKDAVGPSTDLLIKLMSLASLVVAPFLLTNNPYSAEWHNNTSLTLGIVLLILLNPVVLIV